jgi:hypothetical protein
LLGEKRGELVSDDGAEVDARLVGLQGAEPLRGAPTSILDRLLSPGLSGRGWAGHAPNLTIALVVG